MTGVRVFDFPRGTSLAAALAVVRTALADEGLYLIGESTQGFTPGWIVLLEDASRLVVPTKYIEEVTG